MPVIDGSMPATETLLIILASGPACYRQQQMSQNRKENIFVSYLHLKSRWPAKEAQLPLQCTGLLHTSAAHRHLESGQQRCEASLPPLRDLSATLRSLQNLLCAQRLRQSWFKSLDDLIAGNRWLKVGTSSSLMDKLFGASKLVLMVVHAAPRAD